MLHHARKISKIGRELDMKPFINFMVCIILVLIASVEFAKVSIIDMRLPMEGVQSEEPRTTPALADDNRLRLTAIITDSAITLGGRNGFLPSIRYAESTPVHAQEKSALRPGSVRKIFAGGQSEPLLYVTGENGKIDSALYTRDHALLVDHMGAAVRSINAGDTVYAGSQARRMIVVRNTGAFITAPLCAYDEFANRLAQVRQLYHGVEDSGTITIAAEDHVQYDKIIQIMDVARSVGYEDIGIAKMR
jgi:biopolymer transport protein ExbD